MERPLVSGITIDPPGSQDLDDAVWIDPKAEELVVSIADVSVAVPVGSPIDSAARERVATRYLRGYSDLMLPQDLSHCQASLRESGRLTIAVFLPLSAPSKCRMSPGILRSEGHLTYAQAAQEVRDGHPVLTALYRACRWLFSARRQGGAVAVFDPMQGFLTSEDGWLERIDRAENVPAHLIVQECMVAANTALARRMATEDVAILFRNQRVTRVAGSRENLQHDLSAFIEHPERVSIDTLEERMALFLRRADYGATVEGHWALNLPVYAHFTSPIRRYPDLVNQRILHAWLQQAPSPYPPDELAKVAAHVNRVLEERRDVQANRFKAADRRKTVSMMQHAALESLDADQFHKVLKQSMASNVAGEELEWAVEERIRQFALAPRDFHLLLLRTPAGDAWQRLRVAAMTAVAESAALATSVLQLANQQDAWPIPDVEETVSGPDHARRFGAQARIQVNGRTWETSVQHATTRKEAIQRAHVAIIRLVVGISAKLLLHDEVPAVEPSSTPVESISIERQPAPVNAKNALQERCQKRGWALPEYRSEQEGAAHAPVFSVEVTVLGDGVVYRSERQTGSSRKEAELRAAQDLLVRLPAAVPDSLSPTLPADGNYIGALAEFCVREQLAPPEYTLEGDGPEFQCRLTASGRVAVASGQGKTAAKKNAAEMVLRELLRDQAT